jgi:hypothetical protein
MLKRLFPLLFLLLSISACEESTLECQLQCEVLNQCLQLKLNHETQLQSSAAIESMPDAKLSSEYFEIDVDICEDQCLHRFVKGDHRTYKSCAYKAQTAMEALAIILESSDYQGEIGEITTLPPDEVSLGEGFQEVYKDMHKEAYDACDAFLSSQCTGDLFVQGDTSSCSYGQDQASAGPWAILLLLSLIASLWLVRSTRPKWLISLVLCATFACPGLAEAREGDQAGNRVELGFGSGYVEPMPLSIQTIKLYVPVWSTYFPTSDLIDPGFYYSVSLGIDSATIGLKNSRGQGLFGLDLQYVTSTLTDTLLTPVDEEFSMNVGGTSIGLSQLLAALRIRLSKRGFWTTKLTVGGFAGRKPRAIQLEGVSPPYVGYATLKGGDRTWHANHTSVQSVYRGLVKDVPLSWEIGLQYDRVNLPVVDWTQMNTVTSLGLVAGLSIDPTTNPAEWDDDWFPIVGMHWGIGGAGTSDDTFDSSTPDTLLYISNQTDLGVGVFFNSHRDSSRFYAKLVHSIDFRNFIFEQDGRDYGLIYIRTMLLVGATF